MNTVTLIGRLTKDPELRYTQSQTAVATMSVAVDRGRDKNGNDKGADFPRVIAFGKQAENCSRYLKKGLLVGVLGKVHTDNYTNSNGEKVYTTDVVADRVEFLEKAQQPQAQIYTQPMAPMPPSTTMQYVPNGPTSATVPMPEPAYTQAEQIRQQASAVLGMPVGFEAIQDDDIPF